MRLSSEKNISDEPHKRERECSERAESGEQRKLLIMFVRTKIIPKIEVTLELNIHFSSW